MKDRELLAWILAGSGLLIGAIVAAVAVAFPPVKHETKVVYRAHPAGLHRLPKFDDVVVLGSMTKECDVWANFTPTANLPFKLGQHYVTECTIVKTSPAG